MSDYTMNNKDDLTEAIHGLDIFTKNYCMNCKKTEDKNEPSFNCERCIFEAESGKCLIKTFANATKNDHNYPLDEFGAMSR